MDAYLKDNLEKAKARLAGLNNEVEIKSAEAHKFIGMREEAAANLQNCYKILNDYEEEIKNKCVE